jgi:uncharacterized protein (DUF2252 family)
MAAARPSRHLSPESRARLGVEARARVPVEAHAELVTTARLDPVQVVSEQAEFRVPELIPLRHARMGESPFTFYRGSAAVMAADLSRVPSSGITVQLCGDAHLSNFGMFASPDRRLVFDMNDFDETLRGPWEWDVKRLAASLAVAGRANGFSGAQIRKIVLAAVRRYQEAVAEFAELGNLEVWYARMEVAEEWKRLSDRLDKGMNKRLAKTIKKAQGRDHRRSHAKLTELVDGERRIRGDAPTIVRLSDLMSDVDGEVVDTTVRDVLRRYVRSLSAERRDLARSFQVMDIARKVVGVGSVGPRCWIVLLGGRDAGDPLFLQVKEAQESVLSRYLGSVRGNEGARVVTGQRRMQASTDIFLGWTHGVAPDGRKRDFYVRQLHDWKGSATVEAMIPRAMRLYGQLCAWTLARAHARSGDRIALAAYIGQDDQLAQAIAEFADSYADINEQDFNRFTEAMQSGELVTGGARTGNDRRR